MVKLTPTIIHLKLEESCSLIEQLPALNHLNDYGSMFLQSASYPLSANSLYPFRGKVNHSFQKVVTALRFTARSSGVC